MTPRATTSLILIAAAALALATIRPSAPPPSIPAPPVVPEGPRTHDSPGEAAEFFELQRRPLDGAPLTPARLFAALEDIRARQRAIHRGGIGPGMITGWSELGPGNLGGRTRTLVFDPTNPNTMYSGGTSGGVWKSTDAGASWTALDDTMANLAITSIVIHPTDPDILFAATGEGFFSGTGPAGRGFGIFKSIDAGATWTQLPNTADAAFYFVNELVISNADPNRLYAATRTGVWGTTDAGATWNLLLANPNAITSSGIQTTNGCTVGCTDLVIRHDRDPDVLYAAFGSFQPDGLYRTADSGQTWTQYTTGSQQGRMSLALAPSDNDTLYISMADNGAGGQLGRLVQLYRSIDDGASFTPQADLAGDPFAPFLLSNMLIDFGCFQYMSYAQGWYDNALAVDPTNPDVVWVGGIDLCRSDDAGVTWGRAAYYHYPKDDDAYVHADLHGVFFHPDYNATTNQTVFVSNDGGLFRADNALAPTTTATCPNPPFSPSPGITWTSLNNSYAVTQFYHGDTSPLTDRFVAGAQDNGTSLVDAATTPNDWQPIFGGDGGYCAIDPTNPDVIYVEIQFFPEIRKSTDGGVTFADAINGITDTDGLFITPFAMDQSSPSVLWTGGSRPWRTTNAAASWTLARPVAFPAGGKISAIAIAPSDSNTVYLGLSNGRVARTNNALAPNPTWVVLSNIHGLINGAYISSAAVHPTNPNIAYVTISNYGVPHVLTTTDAGATWSPLDGAAPNALPDIPAHWIAIRPSNPDHLYLATELGVFASTDAGASWQPTGLGIPNTIVESLDFQTDDQLVAFTHGRGAWRASLAPVPVPCTGDLDDDNDTDVFDFNIFAPAFGTSLGDPGFVPDADLFFDGTINVFDFNIFASDFGCGS